MASISTFIMAGPLAVPGGGLVALNTVAGNMTGSVLSITVPQRGILHGLRLHVSADTGRIWLVNSLRAAAGLVTDAAVTAELAANPTKYPSIISPYLHLLTPGPTTVYGYTASSATHGYWQLDEIPYQCFDGNGPTSREKKLYLVARSIAGCNVSVSLDIANE